MPKDPSIMHETKKSTGFVAAGSKDLLVLNAVRSVL